jgi:heptosyltransferase II
MTEVRRLVVFAPNWLGDAVMAVPCLDAIRRRYPSAALAVAARSHLAMLFDMVAGVDEVVPLGRAGRLGGWLAVVRDARRVRAGRFDVAILLPNSFRAAWIARRAGIAERWGYASDGRARMLTRAVPRLRGGHQVKYYQRLLDGLGISTESGVRGPESGVRGPTSEVRGPTSEVRGPKSEVRGPKPDVDSGHRTPDSGPADLPFVRIDVPGDAREWARAMLASKGWRTGDPLVGMAPGAAYGSAKQWPPDRFAQLAVELAQTGVGTVLVGSPGDRGACDDVARAVAGGSINLAGATDLRQLAAVMGECRSFVSNDSGAMHLAAAVGVPVVAIFGPTNERETSPLPIAPPVGAAEGTPGQRSHAIVATDVWCRPCMLRECPLDHGCMTRIDVPRVKAEVMKQVVGSR